MLELSPDKIPADLLKYFKPKRKNGPWILRNHIIWYKKNCMPSSAKDRFTVDFESVFFFTKSVDTQYWINAKTMTSASIKPKGTNGIENIDWEWVEVGGIRKKKSLWEGRDYYFEQQFEPLADLTTGDYRYKDPERNTAERKDRDYFGNNDKGGGVLASNPLGRNKRCVWEINPQPFSEAHFAVYPQALVGPMIKAGCPEEICNKCGKAREKVYEMERPADYDPSVVDEDYQENGRKASGSKGTNRPLSKIFQDSLNSKRIDKGLSDCNCNAGFHPGVVLDPFGGSGTTGIVAKKLNRDFILLELQEKYIEIADRRFHKEFGLFHQELKAV